MQERARQVKASWVVLCRRPRVTVAMLETFLDSDADPKERQSVHDNILTILRTAYPDVEQAMSFSNTDATLDQRRRERKRRAALIVRTLRSVFRTAPLLDLVDSIVYLDRSDQASATESATTPHLGLRRKLQLNPWTFGHTDNDGITVVRWNASEPVKVAGLSNISQELRSSKGGQPQSADGAAASEPRLGDDGNVNAAKHLLEQGMIEHALTFGVSTPPELQPFPTRAELRSEEFATMEGTLGETLHRVFAASARVNRHALVSRKLAASLGMGTSCDIPTLFSHISRLGAASLQTEHIDVLRDHDIPTGIASEQVSTLPEHATDSLNVSEKALRETYDTVKSITLEASSIAYEVDCFRARGAPEASHHVLRTMSVGYGICLREQVSLRAGHAAVPNAESESGRVVPEGKLLVEVRAPLASVFHQRPPLASHYLAMPGLEVKRDGSCILPSEISFAADSEGLLVPTARGQQLVFLPVNYHAMASPGWFHTVVATGFPRIPSLDISARYWRRHYAARAAAHLVVFPRLSLEGLITVMPRRLALSRDEIEASLTNARTLNQAHTYFLDACRGLAPSYAWVWSSDDVCGANPRGRIIALSAPESAQALRRALKEQPGAWLLLEEACNEDARIGGIEQLETQFVEIIPEVKRYDRSR